MKKETLEEAAENYCSNNHAINEDRAAWQDIEFAFKDGAKWQAERMYSEEDMKIAWINGNNYHRGSLIDASQFTFEKTIEQLKKQ